MPIECHVVLRDVSSYTEQGPLVLGVFSTAEAAAHARVRYLAYLAEVKDTHAEQGYMDVDPVKDVRVATMPVDGGADVCPPQVWLCSLLESGQGMMFQTLLKVFASEEAGAAYAVSFPEPDTCYVLSRRVVDELECEPRELNPSEDPEYTSFVEKCSTCARVLPSWCGRGYAPVRRVREGVLWCWLPDIPVTYVSEEPASESTVADGSSSDEEDPGAAQRRENRARQRAYWRSLPAVYTLEKGGLEAATEALLAMPDPAAACRLWLANNQPSAWWCGKCPWCEPDFYAVMVRCLHSVLTTAGQTQAADLLLTEASRVMKM
jgi:hypothetical protein